MTAKLHINLAQGVIDIEGEESFVQAIYNDFKKQLSEQVDQFASGIENKKSKIADDSLRKNHAPNDGVQSQKSPKSNEGSRVKSGAKLKVNPNLDLARLDGFYEKFDPKRNTEKILIFAVFLREELKLSPCSMEDIYSCYFSLKDKIEIPIAFAKNIYDAKASGYIAGDSNEALSITTLGENHFNLKLKKKEAVK